MIKFAKNDIFNIFLIHKESAKFYLINKNLKIFKKYLKTPYEYSFEISIWMYRFKFIVNFINRLFGNYLFLLLNPSLQKIINFADKLFLIRYFCLNK